MMTDSDWFSSILDKAESYAEKGEHTSAVFMLIDAMKFLAKKTMAAETK